MFKMRLKRTIRALALRMSMSNFLPNSVRLKLVRLGGGEMRKVFCWTASNF